MEAGEDLDLKAKVEEYLDAFDRRDLAACVDSYTEDATVHMVTGVFRGRDAIRQFHQDRFDADVRVYRVERIRVNGETVVVEMVGSSKRARAWRFNELAGKATLTFDQDRIKTAKFALRTGLMLEGW